MQHDFCSDLNNAVILSTIHSSKGLEYDSVYMVDVYDGRFPSSRPNIFNRSKDSADGEQEERRLFYVGITRAKNNLTLFNIKGRRSTFIDDLFPEQKMMRLQEEKERCKKALEEQARKQTPIWKQYMPIGIRNAGAREYPEAKIGMKLLHEDYGELTIIEVENRPDKTIIRVVDSNGETSNKTWEVLLETRKIKIV